MAIRREGRKGKTSSRAILKRQSVTYGSLRREEKPPLVTGNEKDADAISLLADEKGGDTLYPREFEARPRRG